MSVLVIDAVAAIRVSEQGRFDELASTTRLIAPRLFWAECSSVLHRLMHRHASAADAALETFERILAAPIGLYDEYDRAAPWDIASLLGWRKTYDAEYLAAARSAGAGLFSLDQRMLDGARRLGVPVVVPD